MHFGRQSSTFEAFIGIPQVKGYSMALLTYFSQLPLEYRRGKAYSRGFMSWTNGPRCHLKT